MAIVNPEFHIELPDSIKATVEKYCEMMEQDPITYHALRLEGTKEEALQNLRKMIL